VTDILLLLTLAAAVMDSTGVTGTQQTGISSPPADSTAAGGENFMWRSYKGAVGTRRYKLYVPSGIERTKKPALVVMLHGCTQDPDDFARGTRINEVAEREKFFVLYPEQPTTANPLKCWNWYDSANQSRDTGEPAIIAGMTQAVVREKKIDPSRVYLVGISAGAAMGAILGATYPDVYSALVLHSGIPYGIAKNVTQGIQMMRQPAGEAKPLGELVTTAMGRYRRRIPVFIAQGTTDPAVNAGNAALLRQQWLAANGIAPEVTAEMERVTAENRHPAQRERYRDKKGRVIVEEWMVEGLGHAWSGGSKDGTYTDARGPDLTEAAVRFLLGSRGKKR